MAPGTPGRSVRTEAAIAAHWDSYSLSCRFDNVKRTHPDRVKGTHPLVNGL